MKITIEKLTELNACKEGVDWFLAQKETDLDRICHALLEDNRFNWANWLLVRCLSLDAKRQYAIFAAELVLHIYEAKYPDDKRPREAIEAAKEHLKEQSPESLEKLREKRSAAAAYAAYAYAADAAYATAYAAAAAYAAYAYAAAAYVAYAAADKESKTKIINFGLGLV